MNNSQKENLFLSGGTLFLQPYKEDGMLEVERYDMGAVEVTLSRDTTTASAFTRSMGTKQKIAEVVTEENYTLKIKANSFSPVNLASALGSRVEEITVASGEKLPNGALADKEHKFIKIEAGTNPLLKARLIFEGKPVQGRRVIAIIHEANIKMSGELPLMSEEFATMDFEGSANRTSEGYYTHYIEEQ